MFRPISGAALAGALLLALGAAPLGAQEQQPVRETAQPSGSAPQVTVSADGATLYVVGMLLDGSFFQVDAALRAAPGVRQVHLSSSGGYTIEGRLIAALVRKHRLDTYVEFYCASACTQVFAAGRQRVIGPLARLGFHEAVMVDSNGMAAGVRPRTDRKLDSTTVFGVNGNDTLRLAYELAGTDPAFIDKALNFDHENMWQPEPAELLASRLVTRVAERAELPAPPGAITQEEVRGAVVQQPLWQAALARAPRSAEAALLEAWRSANSGFTLAQAVQIARSRLIVEASRRLAQAEDSLLDRALTTYVQAARSQRERGYPGCQASALPGGSEAAEDEYFALREDAVMTALLLSDKHGKAMSPDAALRYFSREVSPLLEGLFDDEDSAENARLCRIGFETFEAIGI